MSQWKEKQDEIRKALEGTNAVSHSKSDLVELTQALLNSPEETIDCYVKDGETGYAVVPANPSAAFRTALKKVVIDEFGIDKVEAAKLDTIELTKGLAEAVDDVALHAIKGYMEVGRKCVFPLTSPDESRMGISISETPERCSESVKFQKDASGATVKVSTGKFVRTQAHKSLNSHNKVPGWLKSKED